MQIEPFFKVALGVNGSDLALGIDIVHDSGVETVGQKYHRAAAKLLFENICVQLCLLAAYCNILTGALCFDHSQRTAIIAVQDIICIAGAALVGHPGQRNLVDPVFALDPPGIGEHGVDIQFPGLVFRKFQRLGYIGGLLRFAAGGQLRLELSVFFDECIQVHIRQGGLCNGCSRLLCEQGSVKFLFLIACSIAVRYEIKEQKQVFEAKFRLFPADAAASVGGIIAALANKIHPPPQIIVHNIVEFFGAHQTDEFIIPRLDEGAVHRIHPFDCKFHGTAAVQHSGGRINGQNPLRSDRGIRKAGKLRVIFQKVKVGQFSHLPASILNDFQPKCKRFAQKVLRTILICLPRLQSRQTGFGGAEGELRQVTL